MGEEKLGLGIALSRAIQVLRSELGDRVAPIAVIVTAGPNGVFARRALALVEPILRVWFETPSGLLAAQVPTDFWREVAPEPAGWREPTIAELLARLADEGALGRFGAELRRPGWRAPLTGALARLEADGIDASTLRALDVAPELKERAILLANLLEALRDARAKAHLAQPDAVLAAALGAITSGARTGVGAALARGAIVLGDKELSYTEHTFLERWLDARPVVRLAFPASKNLPLFPRGLAASARAARVIDVELADRRPALAALHQRVFRSLDERERSDTPTPLGVDESVIFARTPDDVREASECVRVVERAVLEGTPLDHIAIVLPDGNQAGALEHALDLANLPATWFVGGAARDLMPARLLRLALSVATSEATPLALYELLTHPAIDLGRGLHPTPISGRGRWRRLLSTVRGARGLERVLAGVERLPLREGTAEEIATETAARTSLLESLRALRAAFETLDRSGPLGAHIQAFTRLLQRFARRSEARGRLLALLEPYTRTRSGPPISLSRAAEELERILETDVPRGALTERSIRVLSPMNLLGAELDVVCVLGLTEGRFPTPTREDALLPDQLLDALGIALGRSLATSRAHEDVERRRFAATVGAARRLLWMSSPALDFATERPQLPSSLVLAAASAISGARVTYRELARLQTHAGSRARPFPDDPRDALGEEEHLLARTAKDPTRTLDALSSHAIARGLLHLHQSMFAAQRPGAALDAWTGHVPPEVLSVPGLDGSPVRLALLDALLHAPASLFFRHLLGAWPPPRLVPSAPLEPKSLVDRLAKIGESETFTAPDLAAELEELVERGLADELELGALTSEELDEVKPAIRSLIDELAAVARDHLRATPEVGAGLRVDALLPWTLAELRGRLLTGDTNMVLSSVAADVKRKTMVGEDRTDLALSALALLHAGKRVDELHVITPEGKEGTQKVEDFADGLREALRGATERARAGDHPMLGDRAFILGGDVPPAPIEELPALGVEEAHE